jgi:hypothetical protein
MSTNYLIATTTRFKAAVSGASTSNALAGYGTDQYIRDYEYELGPPWSHPEVWEKLSYPFFACRPDQNADSFSLRRERLQCPAPEQRTDVSSLTFVRRTNRIGDLPEQFHGLRKPSYMIDRYRRYIEWFAKWSS